MEAAQQILGRNTADVSWLHPGPSWSCHRPRVWDESTDLTASFSPWVGVRGDCLLRGGRHPAAAWDRHQGPRKTGTRPGSCCEHLTFTGLSVAENASCRAQQASLHISSVNTGPAVTSTYLLEETRREVSNQYMLLSLQKHTHNYSPASVQLLLPLTTPVFNPTGGPLSQHYFLTHFTINIAMGPHDK